MTIRRLPTSGGAPALGLLMIAALAGCAGQAAEAAGPALTLVETGAGNPTVAVDPRNSTGYVAWVATENGVHNVVLARGGPGASAFAAPVRVNDRPGDAAPHEQAPPQVEVGPEGNVYVLWPNSTPIAGRRFPASDLRFARSTDGGRTFEPAVSVNDDAGGVPSSHTFHDLAVGADGTVYVSWIDSRERDAERARHAPKQPASPAPAAQGRGGGHGHGGGMKEDPNLPGPQIRVARSTDGGKTFGPSLVVDADACPCCRTSLAVGPDGSVYVAWRKVFAGDVRDPVVARLAPGAAAFEAPVRVHADGWVFPGCPHAGPSVAVDAQGRVHVAWYTGREERQGLWYAVSADGGRAFGAPEALLVGGFVPPSQVALVPDGDGVLVAWDDRRAQAATLSLARARDGRAPKPLLRAEAGRAPAMDAARGAGLVAWHDGQSVRARRLGGP